MVPVERLADIYSLNAELEHVYIGELRWQALFCLPVNDRHFVGNASFRRDVVERRKFTPWRRKKLPPRQGTVAIQRLGQAVGAVHDRTRQACPDIIQVKLPVILSKL